MDLTPFPLPRLGTLARYAAPRVLEGTVLPLVVFLAALRLLGPAGAVAAGLGVAYTAIGWRLAAGRRVPGVLLLGALTLTARSILMLATGSLFLYFLQPTLGTVLVATAFLVSVPAGCPLAERLAKDFCPIPDHVLERAPVRRFFTQITVLWAATQLTNAVITLWLLLTESVGVFLVARTVVSATLTVAALVASIAWCRRSLSAHLVFASRSGAAR